MNTADTATWIAGVLHVLLPREDRNGVLHAAAAGYPILPCNLCGSQDDLKRVRVAELLATLICGTRADAMELATRLLQRFGGVRQLLNADGERILEEKANTGSRAS